MSAVAQAALGLGAAISLGGLALHGGLVWAERHYPQRFRGRR